MALQQAQISLRKAQVPNTIFLGHRMYIFDMDCNENGLLCISASNNSYHPMNNILFTSPSGLYIALKENKENKEFNFIYGTHYSVLQQNAFITKEMSWNDIFKDNLNFGSCTLLWGEQGNPLPYGCGPKCMYTPQGIAVSKYGGYLICLWNTEFGERSSGKVIRTKGTLQICTDKNQQLYVFPTYIAENKNGDICVSDVRAVVVTDTYGLFRFRYQGRQKKNKFDPYGICCDSQSNILIADMKNNKIHLISKDGTFLHHVTYDGIRMPRALCMDKKDNVYIGEWDTDTIKVIVQPIYQSQAIT